MKEYPIQWPLLILSIFILSSCAGPPVVIPPSWDYEPKAIHIHLKSDPQLNLYQGKSHTIVFCLYLLTDPNEINQLVDEKGGLERLCECSKFHPSVTAAKRFIIHPNKEYRETIDRAAGAKYVAVVAGYFNLKKENMYRLYTVPVVEEKKKNTVYQKPAPLQINLFLGAQQIEDLKGK